MCHRFLLKYASRDEVEILARGSGVADMRASLEQYEEASPLFGFVRYRRRNVLLKYTPEHCSRLIQGWWFPMCDGHHYPPCHEPLVFSCP